MASIDEGAGAAEGYESGAWIETVVLACVLAVTPSCFLSCCFFPGGRTMVYSLWRKKMINILIGIEWSILRINGPMEALRDNLQPLNRCAAMWTFLTPLLLRYIAWLYRRRTQRTVRNWRRKGIGFFGRRLRARVWIVWRMRQRLLQRRRWSPP